MKKLLLISATIIGLGIFPAFGQFGMGGGGQGPHFDGAMNKLFGGNQTFSATMEIQTSVGQGETVSMPGKFSYDHGKSRFEMNVAEMKGSMMSPATVQQMKSMGMDTTVAIGRPDLKLSYLVYPGLNSYAELAQQDSSSSANPDDYKIESTDAGKETIDGHDCTKNKVTVTGKDNTKHEFTVWKASDLKDFPIKIEMGESGHEVSMTYKNVSLDKPAASQFDTPSGYTRYTNMQTLMQTEVMKRMGGGAGGAPPRQN